MFHKNKFLALFRNLVDFLWRHTSDVKVYTAMQRQKTVNSILVENEFNIQDILYHVHMYLTFTFTFMHLADAFI